MSKIQKTRAYAEGREAFLAGGGESDCPYPPKSGNGRTAWWTGFLDARTNASLGHIFAKYGMTHP